MRTFTIILLFVLSSCASLNKPAPLGDFTKIEIMELGGITGGIPLRTFYPDGRLIELRANMRLHPESQEALKALVPKIRALRPLNTGIYGEIGRSLKLMTEQDTLYFSWYSTSRDTLSNPHNAIFQQLSTLSAELVSP